MSKTSSHQFGIKASQVITGFALLLALVSGTQSAASGADAAGSFVVQSEPAGASVYVDGRSVGETPLPLPTITAGMHRVRIVRLGFLENSQLVTVKPGA